MANRYSSHWQDECGVASGSSVAGDNYFRVTTDDNDNMWRSTGTASYSKTGSTTAGRHDYELHAPFVLASVKTITVTI